MSELTETPIFDALAAEQLRAALDRWGMAAEQLRAALDRWGMEDVA